MGAEKAVLLKECYEPISLIKKRLDRHENLFAVGQSSTCHGLGGDIDVVGLLDSQHTLNDRRVAKRVTGPARKATTGMRGRAVRVVVMCRNLTIVGENYVTPALSLVPYPQTVTPNPESANRT